MPLYFDDIINWILSHPVQYPGIHLKSQPRSHSNIQPILPYAQFHMIIQGLQQYLKERLLEGKGVNIKNFGAFSFDIQSDIVSPRNIPNLDIEKDKDCGLKNRQKYYRLRPCFIPDQNFRQYLTRFQERKEIDAANSQHSVYQQGFSMMFCNTLPISKACSLSQNLVNSSLAAIIQAIKDLIVLGNDLELHFDIMTINITNKNLIYKASLNFNNDLNDQTFEEKMKTSKTPTEKFWNVNQDEVWQKSTLSTLMTDRYATRTRGDFNKTLDLQKSSKDLTSSNKTIYKNYY